jgi:membrane associated rhomboid family serine protease
VQLPEMPATGGFFAVGGGRGRRGPYTVMLAAQLVQRLADLDYKPPVTLLLIAVQVALYALDELINARLLPAELVSLTRAIAPWVSIRNACLNPHRVWNLGERHRLVLASVVHLSDGHLLYNMLSFVHKGVTLETQMGSSAFGGKLSKGHPPAQSVNRRIQS